MSDHRWNKRVREPGPGDVVLRSGYELFVVLLSVLSVLNAMLVLVAAATRNSGPGGEVLLAIDSALTPLFAFDFVFRWRHASARRAYLLQGAGWADLLAILPLLRFLKLVRVVRTVRLLRARGRAAFVEDLAATRALSTFLVTLFLVVVVVEIASATIYYAEKGAPGSNIASAGDAIWWGLVTITTVGYGDRYPVTPLGRTIGVFLLFAGIALFSVLTGFIANSFVSPRRRPRAAGANDDPRAAIVDLRGLIADQERGNDAIRARLEELERSLELREARHPTGMKPSRVRAGTIEPAIGLDRVVDETEGGKAG